MIWDGSPLCAPQFTSKSLLAKLCGHILEPICPDCLFCLSWSRVTSLFLISTTSKAIRLLENTRLKDEKEEHQWKQVLVKLYLNLCLCNLRLKKPKPVITHCRKTLELDPENVKAHFRLGQVRKSLRLASHWGFVTTVVQDIHCLPCVVSHVFAMTAYVLLRLALQCPHVFTGSHQLYPK